MFPPVTKENINYSEQSEFYRNIQKCYIHNFSAPIKKKLKMISLRICQNGSLRLQISTFSENALTKVNKKQTQLELFIMIS